VTLCFLGAVHKYTYLLTYFYLLFVIDLLLMRRLRLQYVFLLVCTFCSDFLGLHYRQCSKCANVSMEHVASLFGQLIHDALLEFNESRAAENLARKVTSEHFM